MEKNKIEITYDDTRYKQNILFYWFDNNEILDYSKYDEINEFCNKKGYIAQCQKPDLGILFMANPNKGCWSIDFIKEFEV